MPLQQSGRISFIDIQTEFGGIKPINISEYYNNSSSGYTSGITGIPNKFSMISLNMFHGKAGVVPAPVQTTFTGTYLWVDGGSTTIECITGCRGLNQSRLNVSTFNNIGTQSFGRAGAIYYPNLILQARAGDVIIFSISNRVNNLSDTERIRAWINLGEGYILIGEIQYAGSYMFTSLYTIPYGTPPGNYALCGMNDYADDDGTYRSVNYYSLHIY